MMWEPYVPVAERREKANKQLEKLKKKGLVVEPVIIEGRLIAKKFWGKKWCDYLDIFADFSSRLPRGKTYVRNGSVCHLTIREGSCVAKVIGTSLYDVSIDFRPLARSLWEEIKTKCSGKIGSLLELLEGKLSDHIMEIVASHKSGLFPKEKELNCSCSCPDWATICKHVAAVFYAIGHRLDSHPELLFKLRSVDASELISNTLSLDSKVENQLASEDLASLFGIDMDEAVISSIQELVPVKAEKTATKPTNKPPKKSTKKIAKAYDVNQLKGKDITQILLKSNLTVIELALNLGVTPASIYRWEKSQDYLRFNERTRSSLESFLIKVEHFH